MSLDELARAVGVPIQTASVWEQGVLAPDDETTARIAAVLGVSVTELLSASVGVTGGAPVTPISSSPLTQAQRSEAIQLAALKRSNERLSNELELTRRSLKITLIAACAVLAVALTVLLAIIAGQRGKIKKLNEELNKAPEPSAPVTEDASESESESESADAETMTVPELIGKAYGTVAADPTLSGFFKIEMKEDSNSPENEGTILRQDPAAGTEAERDTVLTLTVSAGRLRVPDFTGRQYDDVLADPEYATYFNFHKEDSYTDSDDRVGRIRKQSIDPGTPAVRGTTITLTVDAGRKTLGALTDVIGLSYEDAATLLQQFGVKPEKVLAENDGSQTPGMVVETVPPAGAPVKAGDRVEITVWGDKPALPIQPDDPADDPADDPETPDESTNEQTAP